MLNKNDEIELNITGMTAEGNGVGRANGMAVFVTGALPGETVFVHVIKVKKTYAIAKLKSILIPSPDRIAVDCPVSTSCGGCAYRHLSYPAEAKIKECRVADALLRIGGLSVTLLPIVAADNADHYRNKAQYPVSTDTDGNPICGFYANHSHRVIPCEDCALQSEVFAPLVAAVLSWMKEYRVPAYDEVKKTGLVRHLYFRIAEATGEIMTVLVINGENLPFADELVTSLLSVNENLVSIQYNINQKDTNIILGDACRVIYGKSAITDILCGVKVRISPLSFYQVNHDMAEKLYQKAAEYAAPAGKTVLDLYCGVGTIGLTMANVCQSLIGVEIVPEAVRDAKQNALDNGFDNAEFICGDAAEAAKQLAHRNIRPDVVLLDPPRKGCSPELIHTVAKDFAPERVVYVSCDPATLARDLKLFEELGYRTIEATPFDLFPRTVHVETVVLMSRVNK